MELGRAGNLFLLCGCRVSLKMTHKHAKAFLSSQFRKSAAGKVTRSHLSNLALEHNLMCFTWKNKLEKTKHTRTQMESCITSAVRKEALWHFNISRNSSFPAPCRCYLASQRAEKDSSDTRRDRIFKEMLLEDICIKPTINETCPRKGWRLWSVPPGDVTCVLYYRLLGKKWRNTSQTVENEELRL